MERPRVRKVAAGDRVEGQHTAGMVREEAIATDVLWAGLVRTDAGMTSGWHHHGDYETAIYVLSGELRMESGTGGADITEAGPGDFVFVPPRTVHRESNPSQHESQLIVVRSGIGEVVFNQDGPDGT
jgi:uncharacterized RmlC-like cupin family protein